MGHFTYTYRTSSGERKNGEITAESRDAVFATLRKQDIRPIKVFAKDGSKANGLPYKSARWVVVVITVLALLGLSGWGVAIMRKPTKPIEVLVRAEGTQSMAIPLARQQIHGDRELLSSDTRKLFKYNLDAILAKFAEPGRNFENVNLGDFEENDCIAALGQKIWVSTDESSQVVDLKRIVAGMKNEMSAYVNAGGTVRDYIIELVKRQKQEIAYRNKAVNKLDDLLVQLDESEIDEGKAYNFWLRANAQLESMGIYPIPIPDTLRNYQLTIDLDEED